MSKTTDLLNNGIDEISALYEKIKDNIHAIDFGYASLKDREEIYKDIARLRDVACNAVKMATTNDVN